MIALLSVAFAAPTHEQIEAVSWVPLEETKNWAVGTVQLSTAEIDDVTCFRAETTVRDLDLDTLFAVAMDPVGATRWSASTKFTDGRWLTRTDDVLEYYQYLDVALVPDRYWFCRATVERGDHHRIMRWTPLPADSPHGPFVSEMRSRNSSAVEPSVNVGGWYITAVEEGIEVAYQLCSRSGTLPRWIQDRAVRAAVPHAVGDLVAEARRR